MNNDKRIKLERRIVKQTIRILKQHGWRPVYFNEDGGDNVKARNETSMLDAVFAVDSGTMCFQLAALPTIGKVYGIYVVLGNSGWDSLNDWSAPEEDGRHGGEAKRWNAAMAEVEKYIDKVCDEVE